MSHPLEQKIASVRRRARFTTLAYGCCWTAVVVTLGILLAGSLDYFLRVEYRPVRVLISIALLVVVGWGIYRFLVPQIFRRPSDIGIAQRVQERYPWLKDKLATAVEFLSQREDDQTAGSPALRRAVIVQANSDVESLSLTDVVNRRPAARAAVAALGVLLIAGLVAVLSPVNTQIAVARLINPLGNNAWPKVNRLVFVEPPNRLASGSLFDVEVRDANGRMPDDVVIDFRFDEVSGPRIVSEKMRFVDGVMVAHRENVRRPFSYRARGGDHQSMPWHPLEVVEPPRVEALQLSLQPPAYSGWPQSQSSGRIVGLVGTTVALQASVSKPITSAAVVLESGQRIEASVSEDGREFSIPATDGPAWKVEQSGTYAFEMVDAEGITGGAADKWQIRVTPDEPPTVSIEKPAAEIHVAADATVSLRVLAKDRLAIRDVFLLYIRSDASDEGDQQLVLYEGPDQVEPITTDQQVATLADGDRRIVQHAWELAPLQLAPGTQITFAAAARDYQPAEGKSPAHRIFVITKRELEERLGRRQANILGELARIVQREKDARRRTSELEIQLGEVGQLEDDDVHQLQSVELSQREVRQALTGANDGILAQISALQRDVQNNKMDNPNMVRQLQALKDLIRQLDKNDLSVIESELTTAQKTIQAERDRGGQKDPGEQPEQADDPQPAENKSPDGAHPALKSLTSAGTHQDRVVNALEETLGDLQRWDNYRRFARQLAGVENTQRELHDKTQKMQSRTLGRDAKELDAQQRADLKKLAERQFGLARNLDKILQGMDQVARDLQETDPLAAEAIADAAHHAREKGVGNQMRSAGQNVQQNQVSQATSRQQGAADELREMLDILSNRREQELSRLVKKLREAEDELRRLREQQAGLRKKMKEADQAKDEEQKRRELERLTRQQKKLQEEIDRLARQLRRLQANRAAQKLAEAGGRMGQSGQAGQAGDAAGAGRHAEQAEKDLEDAQQRLAQARRQAEADLAMEQLARLQDQLKGLVERQELVVTEAARLHQLREDQGKLTRGQLVTVTELGRQQLGLQDETGVAAKKLSGAEIFQLVLKRSSAKMGDTAERLAKLDTGRATQKVAQDAADQLKLLITALTDDKPQGDQKGGAGQGGGGGGQGQGRLRSMAELKLSKIMQEDLNRRTLENRQAIEEQVAQGGEIAELENLRAELAQEQGELADMLVQMLETIEDVPEDDPDKLPDLREPAPMDVPDKDAPDSNIEDPVDIELNETQP